MSVTVKAEPSNTPQLSSGPSDEEGIQQARDKWKKQYEQAEHATFVEENCPPLQPIKGDSADWTCQTKIAFLVQGVGRTLTPSITYHFEKKDGKWYVEGNPVFR